MSDRSRSARGSARTSGRVAPRRDLEAMRRRREQAGRMFDRGSSRAEFAAVLGVSKQAASNWYHTWQRGGTRALATPARPGPAPRLSDTQLAKLEKALLKGPRTHGYATDLWTLARVAAV